MTKEFNREKFGKKLKYLRNKNKVTQSQLAKELGVGQTTVSNWEKGFREPENIGEIIKIADFFDVSLSYLVEEDIPTHNLGDHEANLEHLKDKPELFEIYNDIYESENLQLLFDTSRDLTPQELEKVLNVIKIIHDED